MDRREDERKELTLNVQLYLYGRPIMCAQTADISTSGLCVKLTSASLADCQDLEVEVTLKKSDETSTVRLPVQFVHESSRGSGFRVLSHDQQRRAELEQVLTELMSS